MLTLVLLYGLLILQSAFYFFGLTWSRSATLTFYSVTALWTLGCAWTMRRTWQRSHRFNRIDVCFVAFGFMIAVSLGASSLTSGVDQRLWGFLLFMVVVPYACGRCLVSVTDLHKMQALVLIAGLAVMPMLLADRLMMPAIEYGRTAFFGMDHSPLMVGALLAATLICVHSWVLCPGLSPHGRGRVLKIAGYTLLFLTTVCLVWVSARGWLLAGLMGAVTITLITRRVAPLKKILVLAAILLVALMSLIGLVRVDPGFGAVYVIAGDSIRDLEILPSEVIHPLDVTVPVLGEASCIPFKQGVDSVAMRWVLYQEAVAIFLQKPLLGVGAADFGRYSCTGPGGFPHSTGLQVLAELGVLGGGVFAAMIVLVGIRLIKRTLNSKNDSEQRVMNFLVALLVSVMLADQIYGNYFMAVATCLLIGIAASMQENEGLIDKTNA